MINYIVKGLLVLAVLVITKSSIAQAPQKMSYQAVIRDMGNAAVVNTTVGMRISILQGSGAGTPVYVETQTPMTNPVGLVTIEVGAGTVISGTFSSINWSTGLYWIKTETDPSGGTAYSIIGNTQLLSVPYAFYAGSSPSSGGNWNITGNAGTIDGTHFIGTTDNVPLNFKVAGERAGRIDRYGASLGNTFIGGSAGELHSTTVGEFNSAFGRGALSYNVSGSSNTAVGVNSLYYNLGNGGTAVGFEAMGGYSNAETNVAVGFRALRGNPVPQENSGIQNTAIGVNSLIDNTAGINNTASGYQALWTNSIGSNNTAIGSSTLTSNTTGSNNTAIGSGADVASGTLHNATALGSNTIINASNKVRIGNTAVTVVEGQVAYSFPSDARFKYNIKSNVPGLDFINKLRPVTYLFDGKKLANYSRTGNLIDYGNGFLNAGYEESSRIVHTGFLAQDIEKICKELGYEFDGLHKPSNNKDHYSLAYSQFIMPLVKGMQEQQVQIEEQKQINKQQNEKLQLLQKQMEVLKQIVEKSK